MTVFVVSKGEVRKESKMGVEIALFKKRRRLFLCCGHVVDSVAIRK